LDEGLAPVSDDTEELNEQQREAVRERMLEALESSTHQWASIPYLASISGVTEPQARAILEDLSSEATVVLSKGKSGRDIARLENR
jgi:hypothetical protein